MYRVSKGNHPPNQRWNYSSEENTICPWPIKASIGNNEESGIHFEAQYFAGFTLSECHYQHFK